MATTYTGPEILGTSKPAGVADDPRNRPFDKMILERTGRLKKQCETSERRRTQLAVTMVKRFRGDMYGLFDRFDGGSEWIDVPREGLKARNIFAPIVRSNDTNWLNASSAVQVDSTSSDPESRGGAKVAQNLTDHFMSKFWTDEFDEQCSQLSQLSFNYFPMVELVEDEASSIQLPKTGMVQMDETPGLSFVCPGCGLKGPTEYAQQGQDGMPMCPQCGEAVEMDEEPQELEPPDETEAPSGEYEQVKGLRPKLRLVSSFEIRIDETHGRAGFVPSARWINYHYLCYRYELEQLAEWAKDKLPKGQKWSESLEWKHALETSSNTLSTHYGRRESEGDGSLDDLLEVEAWWFDPVACGGWRAPERYEHPGGSFVIEAGQSIEEAFTANGEDEFRGLFVLTCGDTILAVGNESKNDRFASGCWLIDATSFWGKGQEDLLDFQEMINELVTLVFEHTMHNTMPHTILDGKMFDHQNWQRRPGHVSYTRKGMVRDRPIRDYYEQVLPAPLGGEVFGFFSELLEGAQDTSGVQPAAVGAADPTNRTAMGQMTLQKASIGLMIPSQKSKGRAKCQTAKNFVKAAQRLWTVEQIMRVLTSSDRSWNEADVDAFKEMNVEEDLSFTTAEGTEVPRSRDEQEQRLVGLLSSGMIGNPMVPVQLQQMVVDYAGVDYQVANYEAQIRLADAQLTKIKLLCKEAVELGVAYAMIPDQMTGIPSQQVNVAAIEEILSTPGVAIPPRQVNVQVHSEFLNDQIVAGLTADQPDMFYITTLQMRVDELIGQQVQNATDEAVLTSAVQGAAAQAGAAGQPQPEDPQVARDSQSEEKDKDRQFKGEQADKDRAHKAEMEQAKAQAGQQAARDARVPAAPPV